VAPPRRVPTERKGLSEGARIGDDGGLLRGRFCTIVWLAAGLVLVASPAEAYRPFDGTDASVADLGVFELELGPVQYYRLASQNYLVAPDLVLNLGIFERTELVIDADQYVALGPLSPDVPRGSLLGDDLLVKYVFREGTLQGKTGVSLAAEGGVLTPEVNGAAAFGASLDVIASYQGSWGAVHCNEWVQFTRDHDVDLRSDVILEGPHDWTVRPVAEFAYDKDFSAAEQTESGLVGAIWTVGDSLAFDAGLRGARQGNDYAAEARLGLTWAISLWEGTASPALQANVADRGESWVRPSRAP
jgi:hypothetical protein